MGRETLTLDAGPGSGMIGKTLGERYKLISALGAGAMGDVYLAEHVILRKKIAVKVLKRAFCQNEELVQRFQQEAIAASRLGHENIVSVTDFGRTDDGSLYFVMEALDGESLGAIAAREGPLDLERALHILLQVSRALGAAHGRGIVHRDLKLDNLVVVRRDDGTELVKVLDFGISKVSDQNDAPEQRHTTQVGSLLGTPDYMSPEQIRGEAVDHRADIYAFGVIAYELATGVVPFQGKSATDVMVKHLSNPARAPSAQRPDLDFPPVFDALVLRALEKERERRFQSMGEVREALARCLEAVGVRPALTPPPRMPPLRMAPPRATPTPSIGSGATVPRPLEDTFTPAEAAKVKADVARALGRSRRLIALLLTAVVLLAGAGGGAWWQLARAPTALPPAPPLVVAPPAPAPMPVIAAPPVAAPPPPPAAVPPTVARPAAPVLDRLAGKDVARVFSQSQGRLRKCIQDNRSLLPGTSGRLEVSFTILASGAVSAASVKTPLDSIISNCVVARIVEMRFPKHQEPSQTFDLPLDYALKE